MTARVLLGDCLDRMPDIEDGSVDMVLTDLPYGTTRNSWDTVIAFPPLWAHWWRVLKPGGVVVLTSQGMFTARAMVSQPDAFKHKLVWHKSKAPNFLNANREPLRKHEDVLVFCQSAPTYNPQMSQGEPYDKGIRKDQQTGSYGDFEATHIKSEGQRHPTDVIYFKTAESEGETFHPTQKPVELGRYLVRTYTDPGGVVLDCCCGSGSFLVAAMAEGRTPIGIEKDEGFASVSLARLDAAAPHLRASDPDGVRAQTDQPFLFGEQ